MATVRKMSNRTASKKKLKAKPGCHYYEKSFKNEFGRRKRERAYLTPKEAKRVEAELTYFEIQIENNLLQPLREEKCFQDIVKIYIETKTLKDWGKDRTREVFENTVRLLYEMTPINPKSKLGIIKSFWLEKFIITRLKSGVKKITVNQNIRDLKTFFTWLVKNQYLYKSPMEQIDLLKIPRRERSRPPQ